MAIYFLILWGGSIPPFEGGQYQTRERCERAAMVQTVALRGAYGHGPLHWRCEMRIVITTSEPGGRSDARKGARPLTVVRAAAPVTF